MELVRSIQRLLTPVAVALVLSLVSQVHAQPGEGSAEIDYDNILPPNPTDLVAVVDGQPILLRDVAQTVDHHIRQIIERSGKQPSPEELKAARVELIRRELRKEIQGKMMYRAFIRKMTSGQAADKSAGIEKSMTSNVRKVFYEQQLPRLLKEYNMETLSEIDAEMRRSGTSIETQERRFVESMIAQEFMRGEIPKDPEIPLPDMKRYYDEHIDEYSYNAQARWEQLTVLFDRFSNKQEAYDAIVRMGDDAFFGGNMQAVAKRLSQEPLADDTGGLHDWTNKGSLASDILDQQIFSLPLNKMSQIIEDENGFHIIKVLERKEAGTESFAQKQDDIREIIKEQIMLKLQEKLLAELEQKIPVWSIFPDDFSQAHRLQHTATSPSANQKY